MKNLEIKTVEYEGVKIGIKINYDTGTVSLVEGYQQGYGNKKWLFADRGLEYMQGWLNILEAMKMAVVVAKSDLEKNLAEKSRFMSNLERKLIKEGKVLPDKKRK